MKTQAAQNVEAQEVTAVELKSYQVYGVDEETGEEIVIDKYLYLPGRPREYRFNGQNGQFNMYGERILTDTSGKVLSSLTIQPISYRLFEDSLFGRADREQWAEIFFIDYTGCVAVIMFNNTSVIELSRLMEPLHYEKLSLMDVRLNIRPEKVTSKNDGNKTWYVGRFTYEKADPKLIAEYRDFVRDRPIFRAETITRNCDMKTASPAYLKVLRTVAIDLYKTPEIEQETGQSDELTKEYDRQTQE